VALELDAHQKVVIEGVKEVGRHFILYMRFRKWGQSPFAVYGPLSWSFRSIHIHQSFFISWQSFSWHSFHASVDPLLFLGSLVGFQRRIHLEVDLVILIQWFKIASKDSFHNAYTPPPYAVFYPPSPSF
jgi:hypothetical protein